VKYFLIIFAHYGVIVAGCATITTGTTQSILVDTKPPGAICRFSRDSKEIGVVNPTPGMFVIDKSVIPMSAICTKDGYLPTTGAIQSHYQPVTLGNVLLGGVVGIIVDAASGAQNIYDASIAIELQKAGPVNLDAAIGDIEKNAPSGNVK
jgi:hypothetical protein